MKARILSISYDLALLETRRMLLEAAGYEVTSAIGFAESQEVSDGPFDLVIMGHSIPSKDKQAIIKGLRDHGCQAPVVSLLRFGEKSIPEASYTADPADPKGMLETIKQILSERRPTMTA